MQKMEQKKISMAKTMEFDGKSDKETVFREVRQNLNARGFKITASDDQRPWGGFFVIDESMSNRFIMDFFPHLSPADFDGFKKLSPKILLVAPGKKLSWQYHYRRSEIWKVIGGSVAVAKSATDEEGEPVPMKPGSVIELEKGERHRLIGTDTWGVVAEIWRHTDPAHPSDEDDIVRLQDDFGR